MIKPKIKMKEQLWKPAETKCIQVFIGMVLIQT